MKFFFSVIAVLCSVLFLTDKAEAIYYCQTPSSCDMSIGYKATDLTDITMGEDLWRYDYTFLNTTHGDTWSSPGVLLTTSDAFHIGDELAIGFEQTYMTSPIWHSNIQPFANSDWGHSQSYADPSFTGNGTIAVTYTPLVDNPSLKGLGATFVWTGNGSPSSQMFGFWDRDSYEWTFDVYNDTVSVPEPGTLLLLGSGLVGLGLTGWRKRSKKA